MKKIMTVAALAVAAVVSACATATPYQPAQLTASGPRNGFYEAPIEQNRWRVGFNGNSVTSRQQVEDALLLRAAELTLQQGYDHFTAVHRSTERDVRYSTTPSFGPRYGFGYSRFGYGWSPYWSAFGPYGRRAFGGFGYDPFWNDVNIREIDRYEAMAEIVMGRGTPDAALRAFNAREVVANLAPRVPRPMQPGQTPPPGYRY